MSTSTHSSSSRTGSDAGSDAGDDESPMIVALFLIRFDKKVGYTIAWKRTARAQISLDNAVEYKSLPSGLHSLDSDLVYFTHDGYAGLSAFARGSAGAEERNANFVSVGILARRDGEFGRLGRGWLLAGRLEKMAASLAEDPEAVAPLEAFWEEQTAPAPGEAATESKGHGRARAISTVSAVTKDDERLPAYHPARAMLHYIDVFGPLVFRLQQAALLRKKILFVGSPPVRAMCEFVYLLSILSSLSARDSELFIPGSSSLLRLPTLFSIGVHDIPSLEPSKAARMQSTNRPQGWAACTTDEIITTKPNLYDIIVELPQTHDTSPQQSRWPRIRTSTGDAIKASQRDVARYKLLHRELFKHRSVSQSSPYTDDDEHDEEEDTAPLISRNEIDAQRAEDEYNENYDNSAVEPTSWSRLAYNGFMWWASAGERSAYSCASRDADRELLGDLGNYSASIETAVIAYFHRQSSSLVQTLARLFEGADEAGHEDEDIVIGDDEMEMLGLDGWSEADKAFVNEFGEMYFGRSVEVEGVQVECCGLRIGR